jgi:hypothetical protein
VKHSAWFADTIGAGLGLFFGVSSVGELMRHDDERMCAYCGGRVAKNAPRNYCKNHNRLFGKFDDELNERVDWDPPVTDVPVRREPEPG